MLAQLQSKARLLICTGGSSKLGREIGNKKASGSGWLQGRVGEVGYCALIAPRLRTRHNVLSFIDLSLLLKGRLV